MAEFEDELAAARISKIIAAAGTSRDYTGDRCPWCGHEVSAGSLLGNTLANGALPKLQEHAVRAMRLHSTPMRSPRCARGLPNSRRCRNAQGKAVDALEDIGGQAAVRIGELAAALLEACELAESGGALPAINRLRALATTSRDQVAPRTRT
ncbi:MAG TPA: hypothetical protein VHN14_21025 [Kofleriaceae bacterium]|jgi:hypothetical protein|nr:hypothetical protein [Kofleriaceae bacterium]